MALEPLPPPGFCDLKRDNIKLRTASELRATMKYDLLQEKEFCYKDLPLKSQSQTFMKSEYRTYIDNMHNF